jgi:hypothetical protein
VPDEHRPVYQYPQPYSKEFWQGYGEPLYQFIGAARGFTRAFAAAASVEHGRDLGADSAPVRSTMSSLNALMPPVGPALLRMRDGSLEQRQISPSLLGSLVIMAQQDLASERRVIRCANERCRRRLCLT